MALVDHGRFRTRGRSAVATVRGTSWLAEETCGGTPVTVTDGAVSVGNVCTGRSRVVRAGEQSTAG
ncbi:MAG: hypothetical protein HZB46_14770 [Solirubrobacterales bacterium]|nr:hypothetical protein [Solirubrobacterales bacterium]